MHKIIVADNQELYRVGVVEFLQRRAEFEITAQLTDQTSLFTAVAHSRRDIVVVSTSLIPDAEGLVLRARETECHVLLIADDSDSLARYHCPMAAGIIHRGTPGIGLIDALRKIKHQIPLMNGEGRMLGKELFAGLPGGMLSPVEMKVVALMMKGFRTRRISQRLGISEAVVKGNFQKIFDKTGMSTRLELALYISERREFASAAAATYASMHQVDVLRFTTAACSH